MAKKLLDKVLEEGFETLHKDSEGELTFSCSRIDMEIATGNVLVGSFRITTEEKYKPEGYVYSSDIRMLIRTKNFGGLDMEISFQYDATGLKEGSIQEGTISIVSNLGEYTMPYAIQITSALPVCMMGPVKNLFHFANLSQTNWKEAVSLFYSKQFANILYGNDEQYRTVYKGLSGFKGNELNVEHFLEQARKKARGTFEVNTEFISLENITKDITKTIILTANNWGRSEINIVADGDFLSTDKEVVYPGIEPDENAEDSDNLENSFESDVDEFGKIRIKVYISREMLHLGKNAGSITISDFYNSISIPITVNMRQKSRSSRNPQREVRMRLMKLYMDYRLGQVNKADWLKQCNSLIGTAVIAEPDNVENRLYQVQIMLLEKRFEDASRNLDFTGALINTGEYPTDIIAYYNYLSYLSSKDSVKMDALTKDNEFLHVKNISNWRLAWFLLYMKKEYASDVYKKWNLVKEQYEYGNISPILFLEGLTAMLENPTVMVELTDFELAFFTFARRHNVITAEMRNRFVFLASREISYSDEIFDLLAYCYEQEPKDDTLSEICNLLMKGNKIGTEYFVWYERAVDKELRINRLYEYYLMSIDLNYEGLLPKLVLMYFAYRSNLDYERNAFLYANVLRHRKDYQEISRDYNDIIREFAESEILKGRINENLAYIYQQMLGNRLYEAEYATEYASMLFLNKITVKRPEFVKLVVVNGYLKEENHYGLYNSQVIIPLAGKNYSIFLEDEFGNRYLDESFYDKEFVVKNTGNVKRVMKAANLSLYPSIYLAELNGEKLTVNEDNEDALVWLSYCDDICEDFRIEIMVTLLEYYFEKDEIGRLDEFLLRFDPAVLSSKDRETCIRIMVARGMYDTAFAWLKTYGPEDMDYKILVRLCDRLLIRTDSEYDQDLLKICQHIFKIGKYDELILKYLIMYLGGSTSELKSLWRAADSFELEVHSLLETMLAQLLFSGASVGEEENILNEYIAKGANLELEKVFIDKLAYDYFVSNRKTDVTVFDRLVYYHQMGEPISEYSMLAYLKKSAPLYAKGDLGLEERAIVILFLQYMDQNGVYFPFFMEYRQLWSKLDIYQDRCFIEYHGKEGNRVVLHYVIDKSGEETEEYKKEEMPHMRGGIFVWSYVLFFGERIRYYITEEESRQEKLTASDALEKNEKLTEGTDYMFGMINNLVISKDMKDDLTFIQLADEYSRKKSIVQKVFKPKLD